MRIEETEEQLTDRGRETETAKDKFVSSLLGLYMRERDSGRDDKEEKVVHSGRNVREEREREEMWVGGLGGKNGCEELMDNLNKDKTKGVINVIHLPLEDGICFPGTRVHEECALTYNMIYIQLSRTVYIHSYLTFHAAQISAR